jgi:hypothetical protein
MNKLKQFSDYIKPHQIEEDSLVDLFTNESSETHTDFVVQLNEVKQNHENEADPPAVLVMRRVSVRQYPGNRKVALYYIEKLKQYITVPYANLSWMKEDVECEEMIEENVMHHLNDIVTRHSAKPVKFKDGTSMKVDPQTANAILKVHNSLSDENKKKFADMAHKSKVHFGKVVDFSWKNVK